MFRQSKLNLMLSVFAIFLGVIGLLGVMRLKDGYMFIHVFFTGSIYGIYFLYLVIEMMYLKPKQDADVLFDEITVMFLVSIPFLINFIVGCHSVYLLIMVTDERKERKWMKDWEKLHRLEKKSIKSINEPLLPTKIDLEQVIIKQPSIPHKNDEIFILPLP